MNSLKQKKLQTQQKSKSQKKEIKKSGTFFNEQSLDQLYRQIPPLLTSSKNISIQLQYKSVTLRVRVCYGTPNQYLPYIFHQQIFKYLQETSSDNPLRRVAEVVGFQSMNLLRDYQISIGKGIVEDKMSFKCLEYVGEGKLKKYKICKCLAIGGFSKVYLVRSLRDGKFYAMKVMMKKFISDNDKENIIKNERDICCQLNHPFIVKLNQCFETHNFVCFVLDYCPGGQLFYYLKQVKRMSEDDARFYFIQILYGLMYLHQREIIYRDLKPQNLLIAHDGHIKIADFGLSKSNMSDRELTYSFCGSTEYMPPEMILRQGHSFGVDFYTLGALLYELVTGLPPFYSRSQQQIKMAIVHEELTFPQHVELSTEIKSLLAALLNKNPKLRLGSMKGLKQILFHPWVGRINSEKVLSKKLQPPHIPSIQEFNFDENQLGEDEAQFTNMLKNEHFIIGSKQKLIFTNLDFINEDEIKPQVRKILDKYPDRILREARSMKNLKSKSFEKLKRQSSSPYLTRRPQKIHDNILNTLSSNIHKKRSFQKLNHSASKKKLTSTYVIPQHHNLIIPKKDKQNQNPFLKKKAIVYNNLAKN